MMNPENKETKSNYTVLTPRCLNAIGIEMTSTNLRIAHDAPTRQTTFTYSVTFDDEMGTEEKYAKVVNEAGKQYLQKLMGLSSKSSSNESSSNDSTSSSSSSSATETGSKTKSLPSLSITSSNTSDSTNSNLNNGDASLASYDDSNSNSNSSKNSPSSPPRKFVKPARLTNRSKTSISLKTCQPSELSSSSDSTYSERGLVTNDLSKVTAKLILIENAKFRGKLRVFSTLPTTTSTHVSLILHQLLRDYRPENGMTIEQIVASGALYFAFYEQFGVSKLRRINPKDADTFVFANLPKIRNDVFLILDLVGFIQKGKHIPLELDTEVTH